MESDKDVLTVANDQHCNGHAALVDCVDASSTRPENGRDEKKQKISSTSARLEAQFKSFCKAVASLDERTEHDALHLFRETMPLLVASIGSLGSGNEDQTIKLWSVCNLYCVLKLSSHPCATPSCNLFQLLSIANVGIWDFFKELQLFLQKSESILQAVYGDPHDRISKQAKELQANFGHLAVLFNSYKRNYNRYFLTTTASKSSAAVDMLARSDKHLRFGWMLFLALRAHVLPQFDLVTCTNGLIAVMVILIIHMPGHLRKFSYKSEVFAIKSSSGVSIEASLCHSYEASEEDVQEMVAKASNMIRKTLGISYSSKGLDHLEHLADVNTEKLMYFEGLLEECALSSHLEILDKVYEETLKQRGELDERVFLDRDDVVTGITSDLFSAFAENPSNVGAKRSYDMMMSPSRSPFKGNMASPSRSTLLSPMRASGNKMLPPTPITSTMTSAKWLRTVIAPLSAEPSSELLGYFQCCDSDVTNDVKNRAQVILEAIFSSERSANWGIVGGANGVAGLDSIWAEQRRSEALKLYYRVLGCMCRFESERLHCNNLSALLTNERFHRCMLACSAELVLATYKTVSLNFPAVLEPTGITAFDVWKVVESFVRHEETLPRELKRHLNSIEEKILEKLAWEKGSSMYNSLIVAKPQLQVEIHRLGLLADPMPSLEALCSKYQLSDGNTGDKHAPYFTLHKITDVTPCKGAWVKGGSEFRSPVKERQSAFFTLSTSKTRVQPPLQSAFASPQKPSPHGGGETCAETVINMFLQKVLKLAAIRIKTLCESLGQSSCVMEDVFKTVQHVLHNETSLFFKRHIDQIILCCMYGVCKVKLLNVTFKQIIQRYKQNPHDSYIYRTVFFDIPSARPLAKGGQGTGDIIGFYNAIFVPVTKGFLMQLSVRTPASSQAMEDGQLPVSPRQSIFSSLPDLSPKKLSANHNVYVSPLRSSKIESIRPPRSLYACVGESTHAYQSPSKDLAEINNRVNSSRHIGRLDFGDVGLVSDSLVKGSLYPNSANHHSSNTPHSHSQSKGCADDQT